jgi:hypothetical protein
MSKLLKRTLLVWLIIYLLLCIRTGLTISNSSGRVEYVYEIPDMVLLPYLAAI